MSHFCVQRTHCLQAVQAHMGIYIEIIKCGFLRNQTVAPVVYFEAQINSFALKKIRSMKQHDDLLLQILVKQLIDVVFTLNK